MMKKTLVILSFFLYLIGSHVYAQTEVPYVSIELIQTTPYMLTFHYRPNDACHHFYAFRDRGNEVTLWSNIFGMAADDVVTTWGERIDTVSTWDTYWTHLTPNSQYKIYIVPCDSMGHQYSCEATRFTTLPKGGLGRSTIQISSSYITDTSAYILCEPNEETCGYYNGIIPADWFDKLGLDSVCHLVKNSSMLYETDRWGHLFLNRGTRYGVVAFGQNGNGEFGDTTLHWFTTLGEKQIVEQDTAPVIFYSKDGSIDFIPEDQWGLYAVKVYVADKSKVKQEIDLGRSNVIIANLPISDYYVDIIRKSDGKEMKEERLSVRKDEIKREYRQEEDGFAWTKLRQDYTYAIGDANGTALTPFIFTKLYYEGGFFIGKTHLGNKLYEVLLTSQGIYVFGTDRHYDKIMYNPSAANLYVSKSGKVGVCDLRGKEIIKPLYDDILDMETYYKVEQNGLWGCIDTSGKIIFPPKYQDFDRTDSGYTVMSDGVEIYLDFYGKEIKY